MRSDDLVSVVVPLHNKANFILRCMTSVLKQSYKNLEVIVVDDGSTDRGAALVRAIGDSRIRCVSQNNRGVSVARNVGVELSTGGWVFFLDADDVWDSEMVAQMVALARRCPRAAIVASLTTRVFGNGRRICESLSDKDYETGTEYLDDYFLSFARMGQSPFSNSSWAVQKSAFVGIGGYAAGVRLTEDSDLWVRLALTSRIAMSNLAHASYFVEADGNTRTVDQREPFKVIETLAAIVIDRKVRQQTRQSAKALLRLQKLVQIRRHVLLGSRRWALEKLLDPDVWRGYPFQSAIALMASLCPPFVVAGIRKLQRG